MSRFVDTERVFHFGICASSWQRFYWHFVFQTENISAHVFYCFLHNEQFSKLVSLIICLFFLHLKLCVSLNWFTRVEWVVLEIRLTRRKCSKMKNSENMWIFFFSSPPKFQKCPKMFPLSIYYHFLGKRDFKSQNLPKSPVPGFVVPESDSKSQKGEH